MPVSASHILTHGPSAVRKKKDRDETLAILIRHGYFYMNKTRKSMDYYLNPQALDGQS